MSINFGDTGNKKFPQDEWDDISDGVEDLDEAKMEIEEAQRELADMVKEMMVYRQTIKKAVINRSPQMYRPIPPKNRMIDGGTLTGYESIMGGLGGSYTGRNWSSCTSTVNGVTTSTITNDGKVIHHSTTARESEFSKFFKKFKAALKYLFPKKVNTNETQKERPEAGKGSGGVGEVQPPKDGV